MKITSNFRLSPDSEEQRRQLEQALRDLSQGINGEIIEFTPTIAASGVAGTVTYSGQSGWYARQGQMVDYWYAVSWSAWGGAPTGTIRLALPLKVWMSASDFWVNPCMAASVTFANAADTVAHAICVNNQYYADIASSGNNRALGYVPVQAAGTLKGHIRYIGQQDL